MQIGVNRPLAEEEKQSMTDYEGKSYDLFLTMFTGVQIIGFFI